MAATLIEIARKCDVSRPTVSRILNGKENLFLPKTVMKVKKTAKKLGYRPNRAAQSIRSGRFGTVGFLFQREILTDIPAEVAAGMSRSLEDRKIRMAMMHMSDELMKTPSLLVNSFSELMVDGLALSCWGGLPPAFNEWTPMNSPIVMINANFTNFSVYPDDRGAGQKATEYLLELGHRRIAYVDFIATGHYSVQERAKGYESAMVSAGLAPRKLLGGALGGDFQGEATRILSESRRPTAILAYSYHTCFQFLLASAKLGIEIPRKLSIMTFGSMVGDIMNTITSLINPEYAIGCAAAEMVLERIENPGLIRKSIAVPFKKIVGCTCAPPSKEYENKKNAIRKRINPNFSMQGKSTPMAR